MTCFDGNTVKEFNPLVLPAFDITKHMSPTDFADDLYLDA